MKGLIMAGGEGSRLRPMTCGKPKPMMEIMDKPVMEYIIELLKRHGITEIAVTLQYMPQAIIDYFGDGERFGVKLKYFIEESPLGTAGSVKNAQEFLDGDFLIISGDCLTDIDLTKAITFHNQRKSIATLILSHVSEPLEYGVVVTDGNGRVVRFLEKPSWSEVFSDTVNTGIYILNPAVLNMFEKNVKYDFSRDLFPRILEGGKPIFGYVAEGYWCDIGDLGAYAMCHKDVLDGRVKLEIGDLISKDAHIHEDAQIMAPVYIGEGVRVHSGAKILPYSVIGRECKIFEGGTVKQAVVHRGVTVGKLAQVRGCILCEGVAVGTFASAYENAVVGEKTVLGEMSEVMGGIKIWPHKMIDKGTTVSANLVWGSAFSRRLFGERGVSGEVNVDLTPEFATKLGATFGASLKSGKVGVGYGAGGALLMLKNAFVAGLLSSGCECYDFAVQSLPITRKGVPFHGLDGGVHLAMSGDRLVVSFLDKDGVDISRNAERSLESAFARDDFLRSEPREIKNITMLPDYSLYYLRELVGMADKIKNTVTIVSNCDEAMSVATTVLGELGVKVHINEPAERSICAHFDDSGEVLTLTDELGRRVSADTYLIMLREMSRGKIFVAPLCATRELEKMGGEVVRCKVSTQEIMRELSVRGLWEQSRMMYDAVFALVKVLRFLGERRLCDYIDTLPQPHIVLREVECDFNKKGLVIRKIAEEEENPELKEGVKIESDDGWVLVIPHAEKAVCRIFSEGASEEYAAELCDFYSKKVKEISNQA